MIWIEQNALAVVFLLGSCAFAVLFLRWCFGKEAGELADTLDHVEKPKHPDGNLIPPSKTP